MVAQHLLDDVLALPLADRMELLERLRESLRGASADAALTDAMRQILDARLADFEHDKESGSPWDDVAARVRERLTNP
jgi:putative addiction module component (TIGR02574 family)